MAEFNSVGLEDVERQLLFWTEAATKAAPKIIDAGVDVLITAQRAEAAKLKISGRSAGALVKSIKAGKLMGKDSAMYREVFPHGKDKNHTKKGVRNAEKGFVLEYGRSNMPARPWMSVANEKAADAVVEAQLKVWEAMTNGSGSNS
jgi:hypothetical protein